MIQSSSNIENTIRRLAQPLLQESSARQEELRRINEKLQTLFDDANRRAGELQTKVSNANRKAGELQMQVADANRRAEASN